MLVVVWGAQYSRITNSDTETKHRSQWTRSENSGRERDEANLVQEHQEALVKTVGNRKGERK